MTQYLIRFPRGGGHLDIKVGNHFITTFPWWKYIIVKKGFIKKKNQERFSMDALSRKTVMAYDRIRSQPKLGYFRIIVKLVSFNQKMFNLCSCLFEHMSIKRIWNKFLNILCPLLICVCSFSVFVHQQYSKSGKSDPLFYAKYRHIFYQDDMFL